MYERVNKKMKILIIRHGEPDYSIDSLTEKGWREAELLSRRLEKLNIDAIYCSPLGRARDTAKPTLEKLGMKAEVLPWLEEFRGQMPPRGKFGKTHPWDIHPSRWENDETVFDRNRWTDAKFLNPGSVAQIYDETKRGFDELMLHHGYRREGLMFRCDENTDKTIALFCHFGLGTAIVAYMAGVSPFIMWHSFFMPTSSVTTMISSEVRRGEVFFKCMQMGDTSHLYAAGEPVSRSGLMPEMFDPDYEE